MELFKAIHHYVLQLIASGLAGYFISSKRTKTGIFFIIVVMTYPTIRAVLTIMELLK